jgi:tetratricopeptide (TPR) repeat protein
MVVPLEKSIQYYQQAYQASPNARWEAPEQFIQRVSQALAQGERPETLQLGFLEAEKMMKKTIQKNPLDFRAFLFLGRHYNNFYQFSQDKKYLNLAKETLNQAILLSPQNQQGYWHLAQSHLFEKKHQEAIELLKRAVDLEPRLGQSHWYLAMAYRLSGNFKEALNSANRAKEEGYLWQHNVADLFKVIEIYQGLKDYSQALELFEQALRLSPKNPRLWLELAKNYIFLGETEEAKKAAQKALELDPKLLPQVQNLLLGTKGYPQP